MRKGRPPRTARGGEGDPAQIRKIAELKMPDLNANSIEAAMAMVAGTARSMGLDVVD